MDYFTLSSKIILKLNRPNSIIIELHKDKFCFLGAIELPIFTKYSQNSGKCIEHFCE